VGRALINRWFKRWLSRGVAQLGLALLVEARLSAQELSFDYDAPAQCPSADEFATEVAQRLTGTTEKGFGNAAMRVHIEAAMAGFRGSLRVVGEQADTRAIASQSCQDLVEALALASALLLNPMPESVSVPAPAPFEPKQRPATPPSRVMAGRPARIANQRLQLGAQGRFAASVDTGALPRASFAPRVGISVTARTVPEWAVGLGLSATPSASSAQAVAGVRANFELRALRFEGCAAIALGSRFELMPCGLFEAGRLSASSTESAGQSDDRTWLAPGAMLRAALEIAPKVAVYADLGVSWPLTRAAFYFRPPAGTGDPVWAHRVAARSLSASLGLMLHFP
jgi:hypothetical protein